MRSLLPSTLALAAIVCSYAWVTPSSVSSRRSIALKQSSPSSITLDGKEIRGPITPLGNNILVKIKDTLTATTGGILLPDQAKERPTEGLVVESGPGKIHPFTAVRITNPIEVGMSVLYGKFDGRAVEYKGEECQMIRDDDVLLYYTGVTMKLDTVVPVRDYVLLRIDDKFGGEPIKTSSGVVVSAQVMKDDVPCTGRVVKVGEGRMVSTGEFAKCPVKVGEMVKFRDYAGNEIMIEGKLYSVVKMVNILSTLTDAEEDEEELSP